MKQISFVLIGLFCLVQSIPAARALSSWKFEPCTDALEICRVGQRQFKPLRISFRRSPFNQEADPQHGALLLEYSTPKSHQYLVALSKHDDRGVWKTRLYAPTTGKIVSGHSFPPQELGKFPLLCVQGPSGAQLFRTFDYFYELIAVVPEESCAG